MTPLTYEEQLAADLKAAAERAAQGIAASNFAKHPEGQLVQDWINERVSYEMERMTAKDALPDRDYLEAHGAVRVLKEFNVMLQSKARAGVSAQEEVKSINEQQSAINPGEVAA